VKSALNDRIEDLEIEVMRLERLLEGYRSMEKDRLVTEIAIFVVGVLVGMTAGFYAG
jgi:hypothetical protein